MELGGEAQIAVLAGSALTTEKQSSSDTGSSTSAGPLRRTIPLFFMLVVVTGLFLSNENTIGPAIDLLALVLREASRDR